MALRATYLLLIFRCTYRSAKDFTSTPFSEVFTCHFPIYPPLWRTPSELWDFSSIKIVGTSKWALYKVIFLENGASLLHWIPMLYRMVKWSTHALVIFFYFQSSFLFGPSGLHEWVCRCQWIQILRLHALAQNSGYDSHIGSAMRHSNLKVACCGPKFRLISYSHPTPALIIKN